MSKPPYIQPADEATFTRLDAFDCLIDARSPSEFAEDHLPGAINCPVLDDPQRATVGTLYKQASPFEARKIGAALVAENIARHLRERFLDRPRAWKPLIYCWRGGQRSGSMTTVFRQIGWDAKQLEGGYKAFRRYVVEQLATVPGQYDFHVVKGATGSAKTRVLQEIARLGGQILDLEGLARHKGSVLGLAPDEVQPTQKAFETAVFEKLRGLDPARPVFVEAESRKIGGLHLPDRLIEQMRESPGIAVEAPRAARVAFLLRDYDYFVDRRDALLERLEGLRSLRGSAALDRWRQLALDGHWAEFVETLLAEHYDPLYEKSQADNYRRAADAGITIGAETLDPASITRLAEEAIAATNC